MFRRRKRNRRPKKKRSIVAKILRFFMFTFLSLIFLIILAIILIPTVFKDDIEQAIKDELHNNLDAKVEFTADDFSLGLISNFPNVTAQMDNFAVIGNAPFEGDTLMNIGSFKVEVNLWSLFGDKMKIVGIYLDEPLLNGKVNKKGKANWDIYIGEESEEETEEPQEESKFNINIDEWAITNARIFYDDKPGDTYAEILGFTHEGSGNFSSESFTLETETEMKKITVAQDGVSYLDENYFNSVLNIGISEEMSKYEFKDNRIQINEFVIGFGGGLKLGEDDMTFDNLTVETKETEFKNILSLVPGMYTEDFDKLKTSGKLAFNGRLNGKMEGEKLPSFNLGLKVTDGSFQYPELPSKVSKINVNLNVDNPDGVMESTIVNLNQFDMLMGNNPIGAKAKIEGIDNMDIDANVNAKLNLADLTSMFPIEGVNLKGIFSVNGSAKGKYNESGAMPNVSAKMGLKDGYVKTEDFDKALEDVQLDAMVALPPGDLTQGKFELKSLHMLMDGDEFGAKAKVTDFEAINFSAGVAGVIDLDKMMKMYPMDDMELGGKIIIDSLTTKGDLAAIDEERYTDIPTSGKMRVENLKYFDSESVPGPVLLESGTMSFNPKDITVTELKGKISKSDFLSSGKIDNYMGFLFSEEDTILNGNLSYNAELFDVDEWMYEDGVPPTAEELDASIAAEEAEEEELEVYPLPRNINFTLSSSIKKVKYDMMDITNLNGKVILTDGKAILSGVNFDALGGSFVSNGYYDTRDPSSPKYEMDVRIRNLSFSKTYESFATIRKYAPAAEKIDGMFNADKFTINGELGKDYMPKLETLSMDAILDVENAKLSDLKLLDAINKTGAMKKPKKEIALRDKDLNLTIKDGKLFLDPVQTQSGDVDLDFGGYSTLDGKMKYMMVAEVPADQVGSAVSQFTGNKKIPLNFDITGTFDKPKVKFTGSSATEQVKDSLKNIVDHQLDEAKAHVDHAKDSAKAVVADVKDEAKKKVYDAKIKKADEQYKVCKQSVEDARKTAHAEADKMVADAKGVFDKKAKKVLADKAKKKADQSYNTEMAKCEAKYKERIQAAKDELNK